MERVGQLFIVVVESEQMNEPSRIRFNFVPRLSRKEAVAVPLRCVFPELCGGGGGDVIVPVTLDRLPVVGAQF